MVTTNRKSYKQEGLLQVTLNFPTRFSGREGLGVTFSLGCESPSDFREPSLVDFPAILMVQDLSKDSHKTTHNTERGSLPPPSPPLGCHFPLEELEAQERPLWVVLLWAGGGTMCSMGSCFSHSSNTVCLGLPDAGGLQPHPCVLRYVSCSLADVRCSPEGKQSQEWLMSPSWWHHSVF